MAQPTIEQLLDDVIGKAEDSAIKSQSTPDAFTQAIRQMLASRSALLSRIAEIQREADDWRDIADELSEDWLTFSDVYNSSDCSYCGAEAILKNEKWVADHKKDCPIEKHRALTTRYAHPSEEVKETKDGPTS